MPAQEIRNNRAQIFWRRVSRQLDAANRVVFIVVYFTGLVFINTMNLGPGDQPHLKDDRYQIDAQVPRFAAKAAATTAFAVTLAATSPHQVIARRRRAQENKDSNPDLGFTVVNAGGWIGRSVIIPVIACFIVGGYYALRQYVNTEMRNTAAQKQMEVLQTTDQGSSTRITGGDALAEPSVMQPSLDLNQQVRRRVRLVHSLQRLQKEQFDDMAERERTRSRRQEKPRAGSSSAV